MLNKSVIVDALTPAVNGEINGLFSPPSLHFALAMFNHAADAKQQEALRAYGDFSEKAVMANWDLPIDFHNMAFWQLGLAPTPEYHRCLTNWFRAEQGMIIPEEVVALSNRINATVSEKTQNMIQQAVTPDSLLAAVVSWINVTFLLGEWVDEFESWRNVQREFGKRSGEVEYMKEEAYFPYAENNMLQSLRKPLKAGNSVRVVLPKEGVAMASVLAELENILSMEEQKVYVALTLPKLDISGNTQCNKLFGLSEVAAPALGVEKCPIAIQQAAKLKLDEKGVKAAAVTEVALLGAAGPEPLVMDVNRPFLLLIEEANGDISFAGAVYNPTAG